MARSGIFRDCCAFLLLFTILIIIAATVFVILVFNLSTPAVNLTSVAVKNLDSAFFPTAFVDADLLAEMTMARSVCVEELRREVPDMARSGIFRDCCAFLLLFTILIIIAATVFVILVFNLSTPAVNLTSVAVKNLDSAFFPTAFVDADLLAEMTMKNKNYGWFEFGETNVRMMYEGIAVGFGRVEEGYVDKRSWKTMKIWIGVKVNSSFVDVDKLSYDINIQKSLDLRCVAELRGRISVLETRYRRRSSIMDCNMTLNIGGNGVENIKCGHRS